MTPAQPLPGALADIWVYLSATPLLGLTLTLLVYHGAFVLYQRHRHRGAGHAALGHGHALRHLL